jgi:hypothetical protein
VAAVSLNGQILPGRVTALGSPPASVPVAQPPNGGGNPDKKMAAAAPPSAPVAETSVSDFEVIRDGQLSTSQAPASDSQWRWLRGRGVNTIVHLDSAMLDFAQFGFDSFLWLPLRAGEPPTDQEAEAFLNFLQQSDNRPAHLSGSAADGRAVLVALARYAIDGWSIDAALAEGRRINGGTGLALSTPQVAWLLAWAAAHPPGSYR